MGRYRKILVRLLSVSMSILVILGYTVSGSEETTLKKGVSTAYCLKGTTATGIQTRPGICAGAKQYHNKLIVVYQRLPDDSKGKLLGVFDCQDSGGTDAIKNGICIDVWMPDHDTCQGWMNLVYMDGCKGKIYFEVIDKN